MNREKRIPLKGGLEPDTLTPFRRFCIAHRGMTRFAKNHYRRRVRYAGRAEVRLIFRELRTAAPRTAADGVCQERI